MGKLVDFKGMILLLALIFVLSGCNSLQREGEMSSAEATSSSSSDWDWTKSDNALFEQYKEPYQLDVLYEKEYREAQSRYHKNEVTFKYAKLWHEKANEYYSLINKNVCQNEIFVEWAEKHNLDLKALEKSQEAWERYAKEQLEYIETYARIESTGSSNMAGIMARFEYDLYRDRAIQLYELDAYIYADEPL